MDIIDKNKRRANVPVHIRRRIVQIRVERPVLSTVVRVTVNKRKGAR